MILREYFKEKNYRFHEGCVRNRSYSLVRWIVLPLALQLPNYLTPTQHNAIMPTQSNKPYLFSRVVVLPISPLSIILLHNQTHISYNNNNINNNTFLYQFFK